MISLIALVFAAVAVGSNGAIIPYGGFYPHSYTGIPSVYSVAPTTYSVNPVTYSVNPVTYSVNPVTYSAPVATAPVVTSHAVAHTPAVLPAPTQYIASPVAVPLAHPVQSQFHSQDELGAYHFGHSGGPSSRNEIRDHFGNVRGSYNYVDAEGAIQTTHYTAGPQGFQVAATNLPVAPVAEPAVLPEAVAETPEVAAARSAFSVEFDKAVAESKAAAADVAPGRRKRSTPVVAVHGTPYHFPYHFPYNFGASVATHSFAPTTYSAAYPTYPAVPLTYTAGVPASTTALRNAELLRVTNNPGHAVSYRVLP